MKNLFYTWMALMMLCALPLVAQDKFQGYTVTGEGAWCWFADPRALHYENESGTINASYLGYIDVHGNIKATQTDFRTGVRSEVLVRSYFQPDDHNNPTFLVLPDERVLIIYSRHTDEPAFYYRVSKKPGDITTLGEEKVIRTGNNTTYPSPFILSDDPTHFYLCWRGIGWHPTIAKLSLPDENDDVKIEWGPYQMVQSTGARPYAKYYSNGKDKLYMTYTTGHPDNEQPNWLYFNVINLNATQNADGTVSTNPTLEDIRGNRLSTISAGKFNVNKTNDYKNRYPYTIVDAPSNLRAWVWQIACDAEDRPVIAMVRINGGKTQHEYYYAKWTGSQWRLTDLADGGGRFHTSNTEYCYSGGEAIDPENTNIIYLSIPTPGASGQNVYEIWKYTLNDEGVVTDKEQITRNSDKNNVRPFVLPGSTGSPLRLGWMNGDYQYWMVKKDYPAGYPTAIHCDYDWQEETSVPAVAVRRDYAAQAMTTGQTETLQWEPEAGTAAFSCCVNLRLSASAYHGVLLSGNGWTVGVDESTVKPYVVVNGVRHESTNKLYTSDNWALNSNGTNSDNWPTPLADFSMAVTYDGNTLTVYRNGLIDQKLEGVVLEPSGELRIGGYEGALNSAAVYAGCLSQESLKQELKAGVLAGLWLPSEAVTDVVLPVKVGGENIVWTSDNEDIIGTDGTFRAPESAATVRLTAAIQGVTREFVLTALPRRLEQNLLAAYDFEPENVWAESEDVYVKDRSGRANNLVVKGKATVDGRLDLTQNRATAFATNGYAVLPAGVMDSLRSYTVLITVAPGSLSAAPRIYDFGYNSGNSLFLRANALAAGIKYNGGTTTMVSGSVTLEAGKTYKMAVTYDARTGLTDIYVNGILAGSGTENRNEAYMLAAQGTCTRNYLGRTQWWDTSFANDNGDFVGTMDDFSLYNTCLSVDEICDLQGIRREDEALNIDCTYRLQNPDFEEDFTVLANSGVSSDRAVYVPQGWTINYTERDRNDMTVLNGTCLYADLFTGIPTTEEGGKNAYLVRQKWGKSVITLEQKLDTLPAAYYQLGGQVWQNGLGGNASLWAAPAAGAASDATASVAAPANMTEWQRVAVGFRCDGVTPVNVGVKALHNSDGSEKFLGFDNLTLTDVTANRTEAEIHTLITEMSAAADRLLEDASLSEAVRTLLDAARRNADTVSAESAYAELMEAYRVLRDALRAVHNPDLVTALQEVKGSGETLSDVYDLNGRLLRRGATPSQVHRLQPGLYIHHQRKTLVK